MSEIIVQAQGLGKKYRRGVEQHGSLIERLRRGGQGEDFWAIRNISFEVARGEILGVIGRNGAGKSTLLKVMSRVTRPTEGRATLHGRVGSLLEVGTGFHPELTGRENVYLNGTILGMTRSEIDQRFDEILEFSGVEKFIDTPVKRYSSGMQVRLAFAVAAHLEPEILVVDEVLAVGDAAFQRKCLGKMDAIAKEGRTLLFVSHNLAAVKTLCTRGMVLIDGAAVFDGPVSDAVHYYLSQTASGAVAQADNARFVNPKPNPALDFEVEAVEMLDEAGQPKPYLCSGDHVSFKIWWRSSRNLADGGVELGIYALDGVSLIQYSTRPVSDVPVEFKAGSGWVECVFPHFPLAAGQYRLSIALTRPMIEWLYRNDDFGLLDVEEQNLFGSTMPLRSSRAYLAVPHLWRVS